MGLHSDRDCRFLALKLNCVTPCWGKNEGGKKSPPSSEHSLIPILDSADIHPLTTSLFIINKSVGFLFIYLIFSALGDIQEVRECTSLWMVFSTIVKLVD